MAHLRRCGWFWAGVPLGAEVVLATVILPPFGVLMMLLGALWLIYSAGARRMAMGALAGTGLPLLLVAYLNRQGPGTTCYRLTVSGGCDEHLNPLPWLILGLLLLGVGLIAQARRR